MKKKDIIFLICVVIAFSPFFIFPGVLKFYKSFNLQHGMIMSFIKFGILATLGEVIGLRIREGIYYKKDFGILPKAIVWGFLGMLIKFAFIVFATGVPNFLRYMGFALSEDILEGAFTFIKVLTAFSISLSMNCIFAPIMMTLHKITDVHIARTGGTLKGFFSPMAFGDIFIHLKWNVMWNFVFKKTIPLFWVPAHTITFLLPPQHRVLFAAILGIVLGVFLAIADVRKD
jgi:hypothetical protein